eukprot:755772-Hanusia_phi.AAC.5
MKAGRRGGGEGDERLRGVVVLAESPPSAALLAATAACCEDQRLSGERTTGPGMPGITPPSMRYNGGRGGGPISKFPTHPDENEGNELGMRGMCACCMRADMAGGEPLKMILNAYPLEQYKIGTKEDRDEVV